MLIKRHNIWESFSFSTWQRLYDLGLNEEGITTKRIDLHGRLLSGLVDEDLFKEMTETLISTGLADAGYNYVLIDNSIDGTNAKGNLKWTLTVQTSFNEDTGT